MISRKSFLAYTALFSTFPNLAFSKEYFYGNDDASIRIRSDYGDGLLNLEGIIDIDYYQFPFGTFKIRQDISTVLSGNDFSLQKYSHHLVQNLPSSWFIKDKDENMDQKRITRRLGNSFHFTDHYKDRESESYVFSPDPYLKTEEFLKHADDFILDSNGYPLVVDIFSMYHIIPKLLAQSKKKFFSTEGKRLLVNEMHIETNGNITKIKNRFRRIKGSLDPQFILTTENEKFHPHSKRDYRYDSILEIENNQVLSIEKKDPVNLKLRLV